MGQAGLQLAEEDGMMSAAQAMHTFPLISLMYPSMWFIRTQTLMGLTTTATHMDSDTHNADLLSGDLCAGCLNDLQEVELLCAGQHGPQ